MEKVVNIQIQTNIKNSKAITKTEFAKTQKQLTSNNSCKIRCRSRPYHFVATCAHNYISEEKLKGIIHEISQKKPYFINNEFGTTHDDVIGDECTAGADHIGEHWHLFFYSDKSINTIKSRLTKIGFFKFKIF